MQLTELERLKLENYQLKLENLQTLYNIVDKDKKVFLEELSKTYNIKNGNIDFSTGEISETEIINAEIVEG